MRKADLNSHAIYGVDKLADLYREFVKPSVFVPSGNERVLPSIGGSYFGEGNREWYLDRHRYRRIILGFCKSDAQIRGIMPVCDLLYFKAVNQKRYQQFPGRYFDLVKMHLNQINSQSTTHQNAWCFFPMYHREEGHLQSFEISAFVLWFKRPGVKTIVSVKPVARINR